ncbi:hypothetical protein BGZ93_005853 [Podila epicladia]|nr:hypothetical protein BGZ92_008197 [Podila epicladia]KAG0095450.1 hypothetical protein BGZ93_005853 [Podila epicladia]
MEALERLPNIVRLSERVVRILGLNPSKFTLQGTNTYLIGKGSRKVLLDTGEGIPDYIPLLKTALDKDLQGATISKVICSHWHHDHVGGVSDVLGLLAERNLLKGSEPSGPLASLHKFPCPEHDDPETRFENIKDQQEIHVDDETTLVALHTPGHTSDHCSFYLKEENTLFTADCVLGQGTAVFEDLSAYIKSLERQLDYVSSYKIYPGHGPVIEDGPGKVREYIKHRLDRENQILAVLLDKDTSDVSLSKAKKTAMDIVSVIYAAYPVSLHSAAEHQVLLHLKKLEQDGKVKRGSAEEISDATWEPFLPQSSL